MIDHYKKKAGYPKSGNNGNDANTESELLKTGNTAAFKEAQNRNANDNEAYKKDV